MTASRFSYRLFGLHICSELELPDLFRAPEGPVDVVVRRGAVDPLGRDAIDKVGPANGGVTLEVSDIARFHIRGGNEIIVDADTSADPRNVRVFLLGSAMGILVHQRGLLPLHANAIEVEGGAVAFAGESGAGKSTLAAWFHDRGARVVADDVCVIRMGEGGEPLALPGLPRFRLWREALERSGRSVNGFSRSFAGNEAYNKYDVVVGREAAVDCALPLKAIILLDRGDKFELFQEHGIAAAEVLFANTYRGAYLKATNAGTRHYNFCVALLRAVPVYRVKRQWDMEEFEKQAALINGLVIKICRSDSYISP